MRSYTTIEQSKHLLELGLDFKTADMFWEYHEKWYSEGDEWEGYEDFPSTKPYIEYTRSEKEWLEPKSDLPCWSFVGLLSLIKPYKEHTYELKGTLDGGAMISFEAITCVMYQEEEPIDAVYEMVCWLIEKNI